MLTKLDTKVQEAEGNNQRIQNREEEQNVYHE